MEILQQLLRINVYTYKQIMELVYSNHNKTICSYIKKLSDKDLFDVGELAEYKEMIYEMKRFAAKKKKILAFRTFGSESIHYGHVDTLFAYSGIKESLSMTLLLPYISHGIEFCPLDQSSFSNIAIHNYIFCSDMMKPLIHSRNPLRPVYSVGPYIHYAPSYLSECEIQKRRGRNERTLLIFPSHDWEFSVTQYDYDRFVNNVMEKYATSFKTILVCAYWNDIGNELFKTFQRAGAQIVTAGFRGDPNFLRRLKSIILLSDLTISNNVGTHIPYCVYLGKPHVIIPEQITFRELLSEIDFHNLHKDIREQFTIAFQNENPTSEQIDMQYQLADKIWGGTSLIKSKEEIRAIIEISKDVLFESKGFSKNFDDSILKLRKKYEDVQDNMGMHKHKMLESALGC